MKSNDNGPPPFDRPVLADRVVNRRPNGTHYRRAKGTPPAKLLPGSIAGAGFALLAAQGGRSPTGGTSYEATKDERHPTTERDAKVIERGRTAKPLLAKAVGEH